MTLSLTFNSILHLLVAQSLKEKMVQEAVYDKLDILERSFLWLYCDFLINSIVLPNIISKSLLLVLLLSSTCLGSLYCYYRTRFDIVSSEKNLPVGLLVSWSLSFPFFPRKVVPQTPILN